MGVFLFHHPKAIPIRLGCLARFLWHQSWCGPECQGALYSQIFELGPNTLDPQSLAPKVKSFGHFDLHECPFR